MLKLTNSNISISFHELLVHYNTKVQELKMILLLKITNLKYQFVIQRILIINRRIDA